MLRHPITIHHPPSIRDGDKNIYPTQGLRKTCARCAQHLRLPRSRETKDRRQEKRYRKQETGDRRQETRDRRQETGDKSQETGDRGQESGDKRRKTETEDKSPRKTSTQDPAQDIHARPNATPDVRLRKISIQDGRKSIFLLDIMSPPNRY